MPNDIDRPSIPSFDEFLAETKPLNPEATNADFIQAYQDHFGVSIGEQETKSQLPSYEQFRKDTRPLNPTATDDDIKQVWQQNFGALGAREKTPSFGESFIEGVKGGFESVKESAAGLKERSAAPSDPLRQIATEAADSFKKEALKHAVPRDLEEQSFFKRFTNPEYLGNFMGKMLVESAPSAAGAIAGGVAGTLAAGPAGGVVGATAGLGGVAALQEMGSSYREAYDNYKRQGLSDEAAHDKAYTASGIAGAVSGIVNALAVPASMISPATSAVKNFVIRYVANVLVDTGDQAAGNIVAKNTYDPSRSLTEGLPEAAAGSALMGAPETMTAVRAGVRTQRAKPDDGLTPPPSSAPPSGTGLRTSPLPSSPTGGGGTPLPTPQAETDKIIKPAEPILKAKPDIDDVVTTAKRTIDDIPIDTDELERQTQLKVKSEGITRNVVEDALQKQAQREADQTTLDAFKKLVPRSKNETMTVLDPDSLPDVAPADNPMALTKGQFEAYSDIFQLEGKRLIPIASNERRAGFILPELDQRSAFIGVNGKIDPTFVAFHELQHLMQKSEVFDTYRETLLEELKPNAERIARLRHGSLTKNQLFEEIMSDVHGDAMTRVDFHDRLIKKLEAQQGAKETQAKLSNFLDRIQSILSRIKERLTGKTYQTTDGKAVVDQYVRNLERVHEALASALAEHYRLRGLSVERTDAKAGQEFLGRNGEQRVVLHPDAAKAFHAITDARLGKPREAANAVVKTARSARGSSVYPFASNILHHMTAESHLGHANRASTLERVNAALTTLGDGSHITGVAKKSREAYGKAHAELPVYNLPQWLAREATIALGEGRGKDARTHLQELERIAKTPEFSREALKFTRDEKGALRPYDREVDATMVIEKGGKEPKYKLKSGEEVTTSQLKSRRLQAKVTGIESRTTQSVPKLPAPPQKEVKSDGQETSQEAEQKDALLSEPESEPAKESAPIQASVEKATTISEVKPNTEIAELRAEVEKLKRNLSEKETTISDIPQIETLRQPETQTVDYSQIPDTLTVSVHAVREATGDVIRTKESARDALKRVDESLAKYRQLAECLGS